jgi:hypothetical protein
MDVGVNFPSHSLTTLIMDPFEVRMQFLTLLRRLNASVKSYGSTGLPSD